MPQLPPPPPPGPPSTDFVKEQSGLGTPVYSNPSTPTGMKLVDQYIEGLRNIGRRGPEALVLSMTPDAPGAITPMASKDVRDMIKTLNGENVNIDDIGKGYEVLKKQASKYGVGHPATEQLGRTWENAVHSHINNAVTELVKTPDSALTADQIDNAAYASGYMKTLLGVDHPIVNYNDNIISDAWARMRAAKTLPPKPQPSLGPNVVRFPGPNK